MKGLDLKGALKSPVPFVLNNSHVDVRSVSCFYCPLEYFSTRQQRCRNWNYRAEVTALPTKLTTVICEEITDSMSAAFSSFSSSYIPSALLSNLQSPLPSLASLSFAVFSLHPHPAPPPHPHLLASITSIFIHLSLSHQVLISLLSSLIRPPMSPFLFVSLIRA